MGSYLSEPITEKISSEELSELLACGSSSMQGWRVNQEDAHNCILDFDKNTALFAVYDGHGGHEVALYCSQKLPDYLKALESYKNGDFVKALEETFLGFDASIATPEVVKILNDMTKDKDGDDSDDDEENVSDLYEEASMPIEQVIEKYTNNLLGRQDNRAASLKDDKPSSPFLKAKISKDGEAQSSSSVCSSSSSSAPPAEPVTSSSSASSTTAAACSTTEGEEKEEMCEKQENGHKVTPPKIVVDSSGDAQPAQSNAIGKIDTKAENEVYNGETPTTTTASISTPAAMENGSPKKGKATVKTKGVDVPSSPLEDKKEPARTRPKRTVQQMYAKLMDCNIPAADSDSEDDDDDNDKTFEDPTGITPSSDDDADGVNQSLEDINSSDDDADDDEEDTEDDDDADEEMSDEDDKVAAAFAKNMIEEPGSDSGCTAVVALLREGTLYVANAGDSRCIVCRGGKAVEMSFDHKPEDQIERDRIQKAGGCVTADGRVNGGLNLSRALGDHAYKQNKELDPKEQMISALPDVKTLAIDPAEDEFMVLACDGIWNFMSSQEVVDFVRPAIKNGTKLSKICEEMFDHCLAPDTMGDGTGCDNMTAIIVQFRTATGNPGVKRQATSEAEEADSTKRAKTEEADELPSTTCS